MVIDIITEWYQLWCQIKDWNHFVFRISR